MSRSSRLLSLLWIFLPVCTGGFLLWSTQQRLARVAEVNGLAAWGDPAAALAAQSPTGYAGGQRQLIVPERNEKSFEWIEQTQQLFARGEPRVRHVDYDNAPTGREVRSPSPYRWWLGLVAWIDHATSGRALGLCVERAALLADPLLLGLWLIGGTALIAWRFGRWPAALFSVGLVAFFPLGGAFLPGAPDDRGLASLCAFGSVVLLLAGLRVQAAGNAPAGRAGPLGPPKSPATPALFSGAPSGRALPISPSPTTNSPALWFALAGIVGGLGVWIAPAIQVPIIAGLLIGAALAAWFARSAPAVAWRVWSGSGAATLLLVGLIEHFPDQLATWRLDAIHPLYGIAWLGGGELLAAPTAPRRRRLALLALGVAALASLPLALWFTGSQGFLTRDLLWARLTSLPDSITAAGLRAWFSRDGATATLGAVLAPLVMLAPVCWLLGRRATEDTDRRALIVACGPVLLAFGFAWRQLSWFTVFDSTLLALLVAAAAVAVPARRWLWPATLVVPVCFGVLQFGAKLAASRPLTLTTSEAQEVIERHLAHWLAERSEEPGAVVFAPPHVTTTLCYFGGLRGLGTFAPENHAGFGTTLAIAAGTTMEEVEALIRGRGVKYLVIPSWDPFFETFAQLYLAPQFSNRTSLLAQELRRWNLPPWLRPLPYQLPVGGGFEGQSVRVFEVVDEQSPATAAARLAEYLVETGELDAAASVGEALRRFPGDVGALAARTQVFGARGDAAGAGQTLAVLRARLATGADRFLPWDRRVSLAIALAQANQVELAAQQTQRCLAEIDRAKLHSLSTGSLYNFLQLSRALDLKIANADLHAIALRLLPGDLRKNL